MPIDYSMFPHPPEVAMFDGQTREEAGGEKKKKEGEKKTEHHSEQP